MPGEIVFAGIVPHSRELLGDNPPDATRTAMVALGQALAETRPDTLVLLDPHANGSIGKAFSIYGAPTLRGDLAFLELPQVQLLLHNDLHVQYLIAGLCQEAGVPLVVADRFVGQTLSHGALIPLQLLQAIGLSRMPVAMLAPSDLSLEHHHQLGQVIAYAARRSGKRVAVLVSGELSHRHRERPEVAAGFDQAVLDLLAANDWPGFFELGLGRLLEAGDCGTRGLAVLAGLGHRTAAQATTMSYEVVDGVGLVVAEVAVTPEVVPAKAEAPPARDMYSLAELALEAVYCQVAKRELVQAQGQLKERYGNQRAGVFITLYKQGQVYASLGTALPLYDDLCDEVIRTAIALVAAPGSPRLTAADLPLLTVSVHVVGKLEPLERVEQADPAKYGVLASTCFRHAVLLPNVDGIEAADVQINKCITKLKVMPGEPVWLYRFPIATSNSWDAKPLTMPKG